MSNRLVNRINDRLSVGPDLIDILVKVEDPVQRLLRRGDVVTLRAEHDDWGTNVAEIDDSPIRGLDASSRQMVADEKLVDNELDLLGVEIDVTAPPLFELELTR